MLKQFFILIGGIFLALIQFLKNLSLKDFKFKKEDSNEKLDSKIFEKLDLSLENKTPKYKQDSLDNLRDEILPYLLNKKVIGIELLALILSLIFTSFEISGMILIIILMIYTLFLYYPKIKEQRNYSDINTELPYALRHMGIELKSGKGLHDALITIKNAGYGSLSEEFNRVLEEVKFGKSTEDSLLEMSHRVKSEGLSRAIHQIISTLRVGGNLSNSLDVIAKDMSFDMQIKLKEYSQKLNSFILIYTFIAILAPVISLIMLMAGSTVMGDIISSNLLYVIYTLFFPMIVMFMGVFVKKLEPKI